MKRNMIIKVITCIMMLVLIATTSVVPVMASPNTTTVNVHYVVADTSLKDFFSSSEYYCSYAGFDTAGEVVKFENKWESNYLYPNIKNGSISVYEPEEYIKKKAEESKFDIPQSAVNDLINKAKEYDYSFTTTYGKNFVFDEKTYNGISLYGQDGELWKTKDYFNIIGCLVDDYTDYNNNDYIKGKAQYGTNGYILNADKNEMTIYVLMTPNCYNYDYFIDNLGLNRFRDCKTDANTTKEDVEKYIEKQGEYSDINKYLKYIYDNVIQFSSYKNYSPHTFFDTRCIIDVFDDIEYPLTNIFGYSFDNVEVDAQYNIENNTLNIMPFAFSPIDYFDTIKLNYKNISSHSIKFEDTDGNAVPFNLKGLAYSNYMAAYYPDSADHTKYISLETENNPYSTEFDNDFFVTEIKWDNKSSLIEYINNGDVLKTEEVTRDDNFSARYNSSYDVKLEKAILNNIASYRLKCIKQNDTGAEYKTVNNNGVEYYYNGNSPYSLTDTTTNVIYEKSVNLTVNYIDEEGKELAPSTTEQGWSSEAYTTSAIDVKGYELTETPSNANGVYTTQDTVVNYIYKKVPDVVVQKPEQPTPSSSNKTEETITKTEEVEVINTGDEIQHYIVIGAILLLVLIASLGIIISKIKKNNC